MNQSAATHPIIAGAYPDPSICRAGDEYYLANSSFEWFPGIPIWKSTNLVDWELAGNALTRTSQFPAGKFGSSDGVYAPTLRFHEGIFYLITTLVEDQSRHYLYTAESGWDEPGGPEWSDPIIISGLGGIDPDLAWDPQGNCYLTCCTSSPGKYQISQAQIDVTSGKLLSDPRIIWTGTGLQWPEGPHLYQVDGEWFLLIAEGGTERGHVICVAKSTSPEGPFLSHPNNPIFTRRSTDHEVQSVGHGDLVQAPDGSWAMVYLGVRLAGAIPGFHVNGRETFLAGIDWVEGWPVVIPDRYALPPSDHGFTDAFDGPLHPRWVSPGLPPGQSARVTDDGLELSQLDAPNGAPSGIGFRVPDLRWQFFADVLTSGSVAVRLRQDEEHWYEVSVANSVATATLRVGPAERTISRHLSGKECTLILRSVDANPAHSEGPDTIELAVRDEDGEHLLLQADGRYLSTEVAGGFIGRMLLVHCPTASGTVSSVRYQPTLG